MFSRVVHFGSTFGDSEHKRQPWDVEVGTGALLKKYRREAS